MGEKLGKYIQTIGSHTDQQSPIYRNSQLEGNQLKEVYTSSFNTLLDYFHNSAVKYRNQPCTSYKILSTFDPMEGNKGMDEGIINYTYSQIKATAKLIGRAILSLNSASQSSDCEIKSISSIALLTDASYEWLCFMIASWFSTSPIVHVYPTFSKETIAKILTENKCFMMYVSDAYCSIAKEVLKGDLPISCIVCESDNSKEILNFNNIKGSISTINELVSDGKQHKNLKFPKLTGDSVESICYTEGINGIPKGVITTHRMAVAHLAGVLSLNFVKPEQFKILTYLPIGSYFTRNLVNCSLALGCNIFFSSKESMVDDAHIFHPSVFALLSEEAHAINKILKTNALKQDAAFMKLLESKVESYKDGIPVSFFTNSTIKSIRESIGDSVKHIIIEGGHTDSQIISELQAMVGCRVIYGYGSTETCGICTITHADNTNFANIGFPILCNDIKIVQHGSNELDNKTPKGELCVKGANVMKHYTLSEKSALDEEGWYHTGELVEMQANGVLAYIDRIDSIFQLQNGYRIEPTKLQTIYSKCEAVKQIFIHGDFNHNYIIAVVIPSDKVNTTEKEVLEQLKAIAEIHHLYEIEIVCRVILTRKEMTLQNQCLSPTHKINRSKAILYYSEEISKLLQ